MLKPRPYSGQSEKFESEIGSSERRALEILSRTSKLEFWLNMIEFEPLEAAWVLCRPLEAVVRVAI